MQKPNHSFLYFFAWLVIGVFFGLLILLYRGDISLDIKHVDTGDVVQENFADSAGFIHSGFSDAVIKAAPAVVSIQTIIWSEAVDETAIPAE